jgi:hypothetical protein
MARLAVLSASAGGGYATGPAIIVDLWLTTRVGVQGSKGTVSSGAVRRRRATYEEEEQADCLGRPTMAPPVFRHSTKFFAFI